MLLWGAEDVEEPAGTKCPNSRDATCTDGYAEGRCTLEKCFHRLDLILRRDEWIFELPWVRPADGSSSGLFQRRSTPFTLKIIVVLRDLIKSPFVSLANIVTEPHIETQAICLHQLSQMALMPKTDQLFPMAPTARLQMPNSHIQNHNARTTF